MNIVDPKFLNSTTEFAYIVNKKPKNGELFEISSQTSNASVNFGKDQSPRDEFEEKEKLDLKTTSNLGIRLKKSNLPDPRYSLFSLMTTPRGFSSKVKQFEFLRRGNSMSSLHFRKQEEILTVSKVLEDLQKDIVSRRANVLKFEKGIEGPLQEIKEPLKRNNSEKKLVKSTREIKVPFYPPEEQVAGPKSLDHKDTTPKALSQTSEEEQKSEITKTEKAFPVPLSQVNKISSVFSFQEKDIPQTPRMPRYTSTKLPSHDTTWHMANNKVDKPLEKPFEKEKEKAFLENIKQEIKLEINPNKPKVFEFKRLEPQSPTGPTPPPKKVQSLLTINLLNTNPSNLTPTQPVLSTSFKKGLTSSNNPDSSSNNPTTPLPNLPITKRPLLSLTPVALPEYIKLTIHILEFQNAETIYIDQYISIKSLVQRVIYMFYYKYKYLISESPDTTLQASSASQEDPSKQPPAELSSQTAPTLSLATPSSTSIHHTLPPVPLLKTPSSGHPPTTPQNKPPNPLQNNPPNSSSNSTSTNLNHNLQTSSNNNPPISKAPLTPLALSSKRPVSSLPLFHPFFSDIYCIKLAEIDNQEADEFMGAIDEEKTVEYAIGVSDSAGNPERHFFLSVHQERMKALREAQASYADNKNSLSTAQRCLSDSLGPNEGLLPISALDIGIKRTILKVAKNKPVKEMFRYFKKKIKNLNTQDYYFTQSVVTLHAESEPFEPLRFEEIPVNPDGLIDKVKGSLLILNKKQYYDELPDDKTIQARNLSKLTTIKTYDRSLLQSRASCLSSSDSEEYLSMTTARIYELLTTSESHSQGNSTTLSNKSFVLGIDYEGVYMIGASHDSIPKHNEPFHPLMTNDPSVKHRVLKPTFPVKNVLEYELSGEDFVTIQARLEDEEIIREWTFESHKARQIVNKLAFLLTNLYHK